MGLCLPSFTKKVDAAWLDDGYGLNGPQYNNPYTGQPDLTMEYSYNKREPAPTEKNPDETKRVMSFTTGKGFRFF